MAQHVIDLSDRQESAAQSLVDQANTNPEGGKDGNLTVDTWIRQMVMKPIRRRLDELDAAKVQTITEALPNATNAQLAQIKTILGV